jgi:hypothetical protein
VTFIPTAVGQILANCPTCAGRWSLTTVTGEDYNCNPAEPGNGGQPLVLGWYELQTEVDVYWQQVNPADACSVDPYCTGRLLRAGACIVFYVDAAERDGIVVLKFASITLTTTYPPSGLARINRSDTILGTLVTGESANIEPAPASPACTPRRPV